MSQASTSWKKVPAALAIAFDATLPASPLVQRRQMFGCPCAFVNGHMFAGLHESRLIVRLPHEAPHRPFVVMGRTMKEYAAFDDALDLGEAEMARWIDAAFRRTALLPPKLKKAATKKTVATAAVPRLAARRR
jgi:TfoX/Sxy family transcriptional regulator of competence genes